jgi:hypothetical protein
VLNNSFSRCSKIPVSLSNAPRIRMVDKLGHADDDGTSLASHLVVALYGGLRDVRSSRLRSTNWVERTSRNEAVIFSSM